MAAETVLVERFGGTWSHEQALRLVGLGLEDSARIFQDAGVRMGIHDIVDHLTDDVMVQLATKGVPFRPGARELLAESSRGGRQDRAGHDVAAPHGPDRRRSDGLRGVRRGDRRRRLDAAEALPRSLPAGMRGARRRAARHRRDRGLAQRPALRGGIRRRCDRRAAHGLDRRRRRARGLDTLEGRTADDVALFHAAHRRRRDAGRAARRGGTR